MLRMINTLISNEMRAEAEETVEYGAYNFIDSNRFV
jgi:hypothetical protein